MIPPRCDGADSFAHGPEKMAGVNGAAPQVLSRELIMIVMQHLGAEGFIDTLHTLERESAIFFNLPVQRAGRGGIGRQ